MNNFHIIGSGACGFLRIHKMLNIRYKGGGPKYQNSFETWNENGLIWYSKNLSKQEKIKKLQMQNLTPNISHIYIKYIEEMVELNNNVKFLCLKGQKEHSIKSLFISWGYRNPCFVKERKIGIGYSRYALEQFPNFSNELNEYTATEKYWNEYYSIAELMEQKFPNNFLIVDSPNFFSDEQYQKKCLSFININIPFFYSPINFDDFTITTSLHGGLGNNLFQMSEVLSFCKKFNLQNPIFGTWNLWNGGDIYPRSYNCDKFLGGHDGTPEKLKQLFKNINWKNDLKATFDTKFVVNDMFRFSDVDQLQEIKKYFFVSNKKEKNSVSLHIRFCVLPADNKVNGFVNDDFYMKVFNKLPKNCKIYVFSDKNDAAQQKINYYKQYFNFEFILFQGDSFETFKKISECEYHILHVSTFSFWSTFLDIEQPNNKVYYSKSFIDTHTDKMIPYKEWNLIE